MQNALPYRTWLPRESNSLNRSSSSSSSTTTIDQNNNKTNTTATSIYVKGGLGDLKRVVTENSVIVFAKHSCCMSHVVKCLLQGLGVNPAVYEVEEKEENDVVDELEKIDAGDGKEGRLQLPAVFIGGRLFGGLDRIMATHISGELTPVLKQAGALWL